MDQFMVLALSEGQHLAEGHRSSSSFQGDWWDCYSSKNSSFIFKQRRAPSGGRDGPPCVNSDAVGSSSRAIAGPRTSQCVEEGLGSWPCNLDVIAMDQPQEESLLSPAIVLNGYAAGSVCILQRDGVENLLMLPPGILASDRGNGREMPASLLIQVIEHPREDLIPSHLGDHSVEFSIPSRNLFRVSALYLTPSLLDNPTKFGEIPLGGVLRRESCGAFLEALPYLEHLMDFVHRRVPNIGSCMRHDLQPSFSLEHPERFPYRRSRHPQFDRNLILGQVGTGRIDARADVGFQSLEDLRRQEKRSLSSHLEPIPLHTRYIQS